MGEILGGVAVLITALTGAFVAIYGPRIAHELKTANKLTTGQSVDATETRRIVDKPPETRTADEWDHIEKVPPIPDPGARLEHIEQVGVDTHQRVEAINRAVNAVPRDQPSLYELVARLDVKLDAYTKRAGARFDRLEQSIGLPDVVPDDDEHGSV